MKILPLFALFMFNATILFSQSKQEKADALMYEAIDLMDNGEIEKSIKLLKEAQNLDPKNIDYVYEEAFAYTLGKDYEKAISICKKIVKGKDAFPRAYQLLGNTYDYNGQPEKAIETYEAGIKKFPNAGELYLERGNMDLMQEKYSDAIVYYLTGMDVDPMYPSNYYWATKLYLGSKNEYLGLIYGEIFMNLERGSKRTAEISELMHRVLKSEVVFGDSSTSVSLANNQIELSLSDLEGELKLPYGLTYEMVFSLSVVGESSITLASNNRIRGNFLDNYYNLKHDKEYPLAILEYQKEIREKGFFEAYNYWLFMKGDEGEFDIWVEQNGETWDGFINWYRDNPLILKESAIIANP